MKKLITLSLVFILVISEGMAQRVRYRTLRSLEEKGIVCRVPYISAASFIKITEANPLVPRNSQELRALFSGLYDQRNSGANVTEIELSRGRVVHLDGDCHTSAHDLLALGMQNPKATDFLEDYDYQSGSLTYFIDFSPNSDLSVIETEHFIHKFYENPSPAQLATEDDTITASTVQYMANQLEITYDYYVNKFGKTPYVVAGDDKIEVLYTGAFGPGGNGVTSPSYSCIFLNAQEMRDPAVYMKQLAVPAHELFHRMQYAFGYGTIPGHESGQWFSEGTASWAEIDSWNTVSFIAKLVLSYLDPDVPLTGLSYGAASFWKSFTNRGGDMKLFLENYEASGELLPALDDAAQQAIPGSIYGDLVGQVKLWHRDMLTYHHYVLSNVLLPNGGTVSPAYFNYYLDRELIRMQSFDPIPSEPGYINYFDPDTVQALAANYYQFRLPPQSNTPTYNDYDSIRFNIDASFSGDTVHVHFVFKRGFGDDYTWTKAIAPFPKPSYEITFPIIQEDWTSYYDIWVVVDGTNPYDIYNISAELLEKDGAGARTVADPVELSTTHDLSHAYPNPFYELVTIPYRLEGDGTLVILDMAGREVLQSKLASDQYQVQISADQLPIPGLYQYLIENEKGIVKSGKLIYER